MIHLSLPTTKFVYTGATIGAKYSRMDQVKFVEDSLKKVLLGPFLNTLS